jgi:ParB family chromosome partitioning protein
MIMLLNNSQPGKTPSSKLTFSEKKLREYFPAEYTTSQMRSIIEQLLQEWKQGQ